MLHPFRTATASAYLAALTCFLPTPADAQDRTATPPASVEPDANATYGAIIVDYRALLDQDSVAPEAAARIRDRTAALADTGHGPALNLLAVMTEDGLAQPANPQAAYALFRLAAETGSVDGRLNVALRDLWSQEPTRMSEGRAALETLATQDVLPDGFDALLTGYRGWADVHRPDADNPPDLSTARARLETGLAADPDNGWFNWAMADLLSHAPPAVQDRAIILDHYQRAALAGQGRPAWIAGMMHLNGDGTPPNAEAAFRWINLAAIAGLDDGVISLAVMHAVGQGTPVDAERARALYTEVAHRGNAHAIRGLGFMLLYGEGGPADPPYGIALAELAAEAGDEMAIQLLDQLRPQIPDDPQWRDQVSGAKAAFLDAAGLSVDALYGAQTEAAAAPAVMSQPGRAASITE